MRLAEASALKAHGYLQQDGYDELSKQTASKSTSCINTDLIYTQVIKSMTYSKVEIF